MTLGDLLFYVLWGSLTIWLLRDLPRAIRRMGWRRFSREVLLHREVVLTALVLAVVLVALHFARQVQL